MEVITPKFGKTFKKRMPGSTRYKKREATIAQWTPLVHHILKKHFNWLSGARRLDAEQAGMIGLWEAVERYDPKLGKKANFNTYAYVCIRSKIYRQLREMVRTKSVKAIAAGERIKFLQDTRKFRKENEDAVVLMNYLEQRIQETGERALHVLERHLHGETLVDIGRDLGVSKERARQLFHAGLEKMGDAVV